MKVEAKGEANVRRDLFPGEQPVGWRWRWDQLRRDVEVVCGPKQGPMSASAIHALASRLYDLFVRTYHFREHLNKDAGITMSHTDVVEAKDLALCADICNSEKHAVLIRGPKSGASPRFVGWRGVARDREDCWRLEVTISHGGVNKDGCSALRAAIAEWQRLLTGWGLS
ncbi:MAG: hypothetical protein ACT4OM_02890 [Actinomycetota bacterium]